MNIGKIIGTTLTAVTIGIFPFGAMMDMGKYGHTYECKTSTHYDAPQSYRLNSNETRDMHVIHDTLGNKLDVEKLRAILDALPKKETTKISRILDQFEIDQVKDQEKRVFLREYGVSSYCDFPRWEINELKSEE